MTNTHSLPTSFLFYHNNKSFTIIFSIINQIPDFLFKAGPHMDLLTSLNTNTRDDSANNTRNQKRREKEQLSN